MAARFDNLGEWMQGPQYGRIHNVRFSSLRSNSEPGSVGFIGKAKPSDLPRNSSVESDASVPGKSIRVSTRLGNRVKQLCQSWDNRDANQLPSSESCLRDFVLLRRSIDRLRHELQQLEFACSLFAKAVELKTGLNVSKSVLTRYTELKRHPIAVKVLEKISRGYCTKEIADQMKLRPKTVEYHWGTIKRVLKVDNYVQATRIYLLVRD